MEANKTINYVDGGTTAIEMHSTQPIIYYNKLNHIYEHDYLNNTRTKLHSLIHPIQDVFHVPNKNNELLLIDNQMPPAITLLDTVTSTIKSVIWSKLKVRPLKSIILFNSEQGLFVTLHKISQTDLMVELLRIKDGFLVAGENQVFPGLIDIQGADMLKTTKSTSSIVLYDKMNVLIMNIDAKNCAICFKTKFSVPHNIKKIRTHTVLQIFAILNVKSEIDFYDVDGLHYHRIAAHTSKFLDFIITNNSLRTFEEDGNVSTANLTKLSLTNYSHINIDTTTTTLFIAHKFLDHILTRDKFNMVKLIDYKLNNDLITLMLNKDEWISTTIFNKNLYLFNRFNTNGIFKLKDINRCVEYFMLDGFEDNIVCTTQHNDSILMACESGRISVFDPIEMKIKHSAKISETPLRFLQSTTGRVDHVLLRTNNQIVIAETYPVLRNLKVIEIVEPTTTLSLSLAINKGFGDYGIVSYTAGYCVTPKFLRIVEINITSQFVDINPLFEYEFDDDIIDFVFDPSNKTAIVLHDTHVVELNKITGQRQELAWFDHRAIKISTDYDSGIYGVILQGDRPNRSCVEIYKFKNTVAINHIEFNYKVKTINFMNTDLVVVSEQGLIESRPKVPISNDDDFYYNKKSNLSVQSHYDHLSIDNRSLHTIDKKPPIAIQTQSKFTNRTFSIKENTQVDVMEHIRSKYMRKPFHVVANKENTQLLTKMTGKESETPGKVDYKENLRRLAGTYGRNGRDIVTVMSDEVLTDPHDIDD